MSLVHHLQLCGALLIGLAAAHPHFARRFEWREELERLSLINRRIFQVHCGFIVLILVMFAALDVAAGTLLLKPTPLGAVVLGGMTVFWSVRGVVQFCVYDASLWRGHRAHTAAHIAFSVLWCYLVAVHGTALWTVVSQL
jgi:hypothetical protein